MMIECEVKTEQIVESIENTRRDGGNRVGVKIEKGKKRMETVSETLNGYGKIRDSREVRLVKPSGEREVKTLEQRFKEGC